MIKNLLTTTLILFLTCSIVYAEENSEKTVQERFFDALAEHEKQKMKKVLKSWTNEKVIKNYYQKKSYKGLYKKVISEV